MTDKLDQLRQDIDKVDSELVALFAKRMALTRQVGEYKNAQGLPVYMPQREAELIARRRDEAEQAGISPQLIEDVLRRVMRDSYQSQDKVGYTKTRDDGRPVVVVGGKGKLGQLFVRLFESSGYPVAILEQEDWPNAEQILSNAALVLMSVPIHLTESLIAQLPPLPDDCVLADVTSVKSAPLSAMLAQHGGPVLGLHPMFGPDSKSIVKQVVIACHGRGEVHYQWLLEQIKIWGASIHISGAARHDEAMSLIQVMKHFSSFVYGNHLMSEQAPLKELLAMSSPIYRLELAMVGRLFAQSPGLYADIIFSDAKHVAIVERYAERLSGLVEFLKNKDKAGFIARFEQISQWFGDYAEHFLQDSRELLVRAQDVRTVSSQEKSLD